MNENQRKDIEKILNRHFTSSELNKVSNLIGRDPIIKNATREIEKQKELSRNVNSIDFKNETWWDVCVNL